MLSGLLLPATCVVCRAPASRGEALCPGCELSLPWIRDACPRCALPRCRRCPHAGASFDAAYAPVAHAGVARDLLLALKLRRSLPAADAMARHMRARVPEAVLRDSTLVPIPSPTSTRLAHALGRLAGRPVVTCLGRTSDRATRQLGRTRAARGDRGRLRVSGKTPSAGPLLLIDDVHTTGGTLESGARALRDSGFLHIAALTFVRTLTSA